MDLYQNWHNRPFCIRVYSKIDIDDDDDYDEYDVLYIVLYNIVLCILYVDLKIYIIIDML